MDRADIMAAMGELKLYGMRAAYDELMAVAVRRQHEPRQAQVQQLRQPARLARPGRRRRFDARAQPGRVVQLHLDLERRQHLPLRRQPLQDPVDPRPHGEQQPLAVVIVFGTLTAFALTMVLHMVRHFAFDRFSGFRAFSWLTGLLLLWLVYVAGVNGYMLPWDRLAQFVIVTAR